MTNHKRAVMTDWMAQDVARHFLLMGIQQWGQSVKDREKATRQYVAAAGKKFGSNEANEWLDVVLANLRRGKLETEVEQLAASLMTAQRGGLK